MIDIEIMQDASEIIHYDSPEISFAVQERSLSNYTDMRALCHWHDDLELLYIFDGEMNYEVNGQKYLLQKGDTIFINSRKLHYGYDNNRRECEFMVVLIHPELLKASNYMYHISTSTIRIISRSKISLQPAWSAAVNAAVSSRNTFPSHQSPS